MISFIVLFFAVFRLSLAVNYCPPLGPVYAVPQNLSANDSVRQTAQNVSATLENLLKKGGNASPGFDPNTTSFSVNLFSVHESDSIFQYHFTASTLNASSTKIIDQDSVYRIGSITKLVTVFGLLLEGERVHFDDPVTKYVPELAAIAEAQRTKREDDEVATAEWSQITVGALAGHLAGIGRTYTTGDLSGTELLEEAFGFPKLNSSLIPSCGKDFTQAPCSREDFFDGFTKRHPVYAPFTTPVYSNAGFQILGYVIENVTGEPYEVAIANSIFKPLNLSRTSLKPSSNSSWGVIPVGDSEWDNYEGGQSSAGGIYTSTRDLSNIARAILKSTLLSPTQTREWLKPDTHTASLEFSVGKPWEIKRVNSLTADHRVVDLYTKNGGIGLYGSLLILVPDYDVALTVLVAGPANPESQLASMIMEAFIPVIEKVGKEQAATLYAGSYESHSSDSVLNITVDNGPGLHINQWTSNGKDILQAFKAFTKEVGNVDFRLYPTGLKNAHEVSFRAIFHVLPVDETADSQTKNGGTFSDPCTSWFGVDGFQYGLNAVDDFLFHLDGFGRVSGVEPRVLRQTLTRKDPVITAQI